MGALFGSASPHCPAKAPFLPLKSLLNLLFILPLLLASFAHAAPLEGRQDAELAGRPKPMSLPTIVLVPGAWHLPIHYSLLILKLKSYGFPVESEKLPSVNSPKPKEQSVAKDADFIKNSVLKPLLDAGKDVVMLLHSYGGCPGSVAAKGQSKTERAAAGKKGGVVGLIFMCAFVAPEGASLKGSLPGGVYDPWVIVNSQTGQTTVQNPKDVFYTDVSLPLTTIAIAALGQHAEASLSSPSPPPAWPDAVFNGKRAYIQTERDATIPFVAQDAMVTYSGVTWDILKLNTGHSPFLSKTVETAEYVRDKAKAYAGVV